MSLLFIKKGFKIKGNFSSMKYNENIKYLKVDAKQQKSADN